MGGDTQLKEHVEDELRWQPNVDEASIGTAWALCRMATQGRTLLTRRQGMQQALPAKSV